jgi:hypothetical protein
MQALMVLLALVAAAPAAPKPIFATKSESAFIDDGFALAPQGDRLAYIRTNGADVVQIEIVSLPAGKTDATFSIAQFTKTPERVLFTPDGKHVVVLSKAPEEDKREAQAYDLAGKPVGKKIGPTQQIAVSSVDGKPVVVTFSDRDKEGVHTYDVTAFSTDGRQLAKKTLSADKTGLMREKAAGPDGFKVVYWFDDFLRLVGQKKGEYDKKNDVRRPDRAMVWDVFKAKPLEEHEIGDVMEWVKEQRDRVRHPHTAAFAQYSEDLKTLELITPDGKRRPLELGRLLYKYEPKSLLQQAGPEANRLYISVTVDPVNWEAVQHKHAEPDLFDLYAIDTQSGKAQRVLTGLLAGKRALTWTAAGGRVAILHKHKGFDRGGLELEVYDLTP